MVGAVGVERVWGGGSAAGWSSPGFKQGGGGVLRLGSDERAKGSTKSSSGTLVVRGRSLEESGGLCRGRSTAASRWRPSGRFWKRRGGVARGGGSSARQQEGEELRGDAWVTARGEVMAGMAGKPLHDDGGRRCRWTATRYRAGGGGGRKWRFCNFQKFQGLTCKPAITFKPKLKWKSAQHESCSTFQDLQL